MWPFKKKLALFDYTNQLRFQSDLSLEESVQRLKSLAIQLSITNFWKGFAQISTSYSKEKMTLYGNVSKHRVVLGAIQWYLKDSLKPYFFGKFIESDGKVFLQGKFTMHWLVKIFMTVFLVFILIFSIAIIFGSLDLTNKTSIISIKIFAAPLMLLFWVIFILVGKRLGKQQLEFILGILSKEFRIIENS